MSLPTKFLAEACLPILRPAPAVTEVWRGGVGRLSCLTQFLGTGLRHGDIQIVALTFEAAKELGMILARASISIADVHRRRPSPTSIADAAVCRSAFLTHGMVVTVLVATIIGISFRDLPARRLELRGTGASY